MGEIQVRVSKWLGAASGRGGRGPRNIAITKIPSKQCVPLLFTLCFLYSNNGASIRADEE